MLHNIGSISRLVAFYVLAAVLWVLGTDLLAAQLEQRFGLPEWIQTFKGVAFVLFSAGILFWLLVRELRRREADYQHHLEEKEHLLQQLRAKNLELSDAYDRTIFGWSRVLEMRNREVKDHSRRVTVLALRLARKLNVPEEDLDHIRRGALLHDIGKMAIADSIILKETGLTEEERAIIRRHTLFGFEMVSEIEFLRPAMDILLCHHEKWDGTGYPFGLAGEQIPLYARIFSVVDVWDALSADDRVYRKADPPEVAAEYLRQQAGEQFDPAIVEAFLEMIEDEGADTGESVLAWKDRAVGL
jgi:putative nucleotidyltransferase with HDIG domain